MIWLARAEVAAIGFEMSGFSARILVMGPRPLQSIPPAIADARIAADDP
jgi:hypothetical protein